MFYNCFTIQKKYSKHSDIQDLVESYEEAYEGGIYGKNSKIPLDETVKALEDRKNNKEELPKKILYMEHDNGPSVLFLDRDSNVFERITTDNEGALIERSWPVIRWNIRK